MSELLLNADEAFVVPSCTGRPHCFDMRRVFRAESRLIELSGLTKAKAGELLHCFIQAFDDAKTHLATLRGEHMRSKQKVRSVRAVVVLDKASKVLQEKGLASTRSPAGSEDLRSAVVDSNQDYLDAAEHFAQIEAAVEFMEGKVEVLKMAYFSTNKLSDSFEGRRDTSGGTGDDDLGAMTQSERVQEFVSKHATVDRESYQQTKGFGAPKL